MDPELKKAVEGIHALAKDNHHMLRAIRRAQLMGFVGKLVIWVIVLLLPLYLYQQYLGPILSTFSGTSGTTPTGIFGLPTTADLQKLLDSYKPQ